MTRLTALFFKDVKNIKAVDWFAEGFSEKRLLRVPFLAFMVPKGIMKRNVEAITTQVLQSTLSKEDFEDKKAIVLLTIKRKIISICLQQYHGTYMKNPRYLLLLRDLGYNKRFVVNKEQMYTEIKAINLQIQVISRRAIDQEGTPENVYTRIARISAFLGLIISESISLFGLLAFQKIAVERVSEARKTKLKGGTHG